MKYRKLGRNGPTVSAISMGRGSQAIKFDDAPMVQAFDATIRRAFDLGINFFDSSDAYWGTRHEVLLGRAIKGFRDKVLISSKFGNIDLPDGKKGTNGKPEYLRQCCDDSLKRMGVDVIDVYYQHRVDPGGADRGDGGRDGAAGRAGQGALARHLRGRARDAQARAQDPPDRGAAVRVFAVVSRDRARHPADLPRAGHCRTSPTRRSGAGCSPAASGPWTTCRRPTAGASTRASSRKTWRRT